MQADGDTQRKEEYNKVEWSFDHNPRVSFFYHPVSVNHLLVYNLLCQENTQCGDVEHIKNKSSSYLKQFCIFSVARWTH